MKGILSIAAMSVVLAFGVTVNAEEAPITQVNVAKASSFSLLQGIPADPLTPQAMEAVRGTNHVIRLVELRSGDALTNLAAAYNATDAAGSLSGAMNVGNAQDRVKITGLLF
jgi:hypothetical protein